MDTWLWLWHVRDSRADSVPIREKVLRREEIFTEITIERRRQKILHPEPLGIAWMSVLVEEIGEAAKEENEGFLNAARQEWIEAAAVIVRHLEENY